MTTKKTTTKKVVKKVITAKRPAAKTIEKPAAPKRSAVKGLQLKVKVQTAEGWRRKKIAAKTKGSKS